MDYEIIIKVSVDPDANFLEVGGVNNSNVIKQVVSDCLYDIDDLEGTSEASDIKKEQRRMRQELLEDMF